MKAKDIHPEIAGYLKEHVLWYNNLMLTGLLFSLFYLESSPSKDVNKVRAEISFIFENNFFDYLSYQLGYVCRYFLLAVNNFPVYPKPVQRHL